jgi:hypothetical protein
MKLGKFNNVEIIGKILEEYNTPPPELSGHKIENVTIRITYHNVKNTKWGFKKTKYMGSSVQYFTDVIRVINDEELDPRSLYPKISNVFEKSPFDHIYDGLISKIDMQLLYSYSLEGRSIWQKEATSSFDEEAKWSKEDYNEYDLLVGIQRAENAINRIHEMFEEQNEKLEECKKGLDDLRERKRKRAGE